MLSIQEFLNVINGRSSLTDPEAVGSEIESLKPVLEAGLDYYKPASSASETKIKSSTTVKRKEFIVKLSKFLDLDAVQTNDLFQNYLRLSFRGSGPQLQAILKHETQLETFLLKVLEFYFKERSSLLACLKYLFTYWQDETCLFRNEFVKTVDSLANIDIMKKITKQLKDSFKRPSNHDAIKGYPLVISQFAMQYVKEQCYLAEIVFLYYKDFDMPLDAFLDLANFFRCQHFGLSQVNQKFLPPQVEALTNRFGYISSLILLEGLDLELLRKFSCNEDRSDVTEHHLMSDKAWRKVDELLYSWDDVPQQGPVLMAWTLFRQLCLPAEQQPLTKVFGDAALRCNVIGYLHQITLCLQSFSDPLMSLVKSFVYVLLSVILTLFHEDSLGDYQAVVAVACATISDPVISHVFWTQDQGGGVAMLLDAAKKRFPAMSCPYIDLLTNLCTAKAIAEYVFEDFDQLTSFTELFGKNSVSEIEASDEKGSWHRTTNRVVLKHLTDSLILPAGVDGKVFQHKQDTRLIRWNFSFSGWRYVLLQLNAIAQNPMTYTSDCGEDGLLIAKSVIRLCSVIIKHDASKAEDMEPIIATTIRLVQGLSQLPSPPLDVLAACLQCLQLIVYQIPIQIWNQLLKTKFLPSQKVVIIKVRCENSLQLSPGIYGMIISKHEVPSGNFPVTKEYLKLLYDSLNAIMVGELGKNNSAGMNEILNDLAVNISFVIKEIFVNFGKWRYSNAEDKEMIGEKCLEIFHTILSPNFIDINVEDNKSAPSLKAIVMEGLLYHNAAGSLISIIGIGVDGIETLFLDSARQDTKLVQLVKLSFAVINKLFPEKDENAALSPLEEALCHQYVQQVPDVDFIQETNKVTIPSVIAKFIFHRQDPKLAILAMIVLRGLAAKFPMMLTASFGEAIIGIRNAFVNKLNGRVEAVRLKISIIEFLTTCVETQPGIIESFSHLVKEKNETKLGRFSCLTPLLEILLDKKHINVLSSTVMEFVAALWMNRHDIAMQVIKKRKHFWCSVMHTLLKSDSLKVDKSLLEVTSHALKIVAVETYYVRDDQFSEELKKKFKKLSDGKCYTTIGKYILPSEIDVDNVTPVESATCKLSLIKSWKIFLSVMVKNQGSVCGLTTKKISIAVLDDIIKAIAAWVKLKPSQIQREILVELSNLCWTLCFNWKNILTPSQMSSSLLGILQQIMDGDEALLSSLQLPLFSTALLLTQQKPEVTGRKGDDSLIKLGSLACQWLHQYGKTENYTQTRLVMLHLLSELVKSADAESVDALLKLFKDCSIMSKLLHILDVNLQKKSNLEFAETALMLLLAASEEKKLAEHLMNNGIGKFLCLSVEGIFKSAGDVEKVTKDQLLQIWCLLLGITGRLLQALKYAFVETAIDFVGTHKEALAQSLKIIELLVDGNKLLIAEQASLLFYELSVYEADIIFALPEVFVELKFEVIQMAKVAIALLARQKILTHLVELKPGENIEQIITKTASPTLLRSDSAKSSVGNDAVDTPSRDVEVAHNRLVNVLCNCVGMMRRLTPNVVESLFDEGMDISAFLPLIDLRFDVPSLDTESPPSFGSLISCLNVCLKLLNKASQGDADQSSSEKDFLSSLITDDERKRSYLWFIMENVLIVLLSQASCYLRHPGVEERQKHFLKRELGSELSNFLHGVNRLKSRRAIPPSPISSEKHGSTSVPSLSTRRSPSKLSTSFSEEDDNSSLFRFIDSFAKTLLR